MAFGELWHHHSVIVFVQIILQLLADIIGLFMLSVRARRSVLAAEAMAVAVVRAVRSAKGIEGFPAVGDIKS